MSVLHLHFSASRMPLFARFGRGKLRFRILWLTVFYFDLQRMERLL